MHSKSKEQNKFVSLETNEIVHFEDMRIKTKNFDSVKQEMYRDNYRVRKALKKYGIEAKRIH